MSDGENSDVGLGFDVDNVVRESGHATTSNWQVRWHSRDGNAGSWHRDDLVNRCVNRVEEFNPKITSCHVVVDEADRHKRKGKHFEVRVDLHVPGKEIVSSMKDNEDPYIAATEAFHVVMRQLDEDLDRRRGEVKRHVDERGDNAAP